MKHLLLAISALLIATASAWSAPLASVKAYTDSATLVQGDRVTVNVEVVTDNLHGSLIGLPAPEQDYYGMEMVKTTTDTTSLGNGRYQVDYHVTLQAFDPSELLTLPPFAFAADGDTAYSDILTFKVLPVELSPELGDPADIESLTIHPEEPPVKIKARWYDYVPDWAPWALIALALAALAVVLYMLYKKNGPSLFTPKRPIPPYELAVERLTALKQRHMLEQGHVKQYYTELIDIYRSYLEGRFGINALEMTSKQILRKIRENKEIHLSASQMEQVLQLADFVKFAAAHPEASEGQRTFNTIADFVESTKPQPTEEELAEQEKKKPRTNKRK